jgi:hypothetical protein
MKAASNPSFDFLPLSIRIETLGGVATPLLLRGTPLPARRSEVFVTSADNQTRVSAELYMGESPLAKNNIQLGKVEISDIPPAKRGEPKIDLEFSVSKTCTVTARASLRGTSLRVEETFGPPQELSEEFIAKALADASSTRADDEAELLQAEATNRAKSLIVRAEELLSKGPQAKLSEAVAALGLALASGDSGSIREKSDVVEDLVTRASLFGSGSFDFSDLFGSFTTPVKTTPSTSPRTREQRPSEQKLAPPSHTQVLGRIFGGTSFTLDPLLCFVLMPFDSKLQPLYDDHIRPTVTGSGLRCERADDIRGPNLITWDIWERINRARFLLADLTDQNSNVFYELGLAHALSKDVILITQSMNFVPFDLKTIRCIVYDFTPRGIEKFERALTETIAALMKSA